MHNEFVPRLANKFAKSKFQQQFLGATLDNTCKNETVGNFHRNCFEVLLEFGFKPFIEAVVPVAVLAIIGVSAEIAILFAESVLDLLHAPEKHAFGLDP